MEPKDIMRKQCDYRQGYIPLMVVVSRFKEKDLFILRKLKSIPHKITAYFDRKKIVAVHKSDCFAKQENYYLILATDGTVFHVDY